MAIAFDAASGGSGYPVTSLTVSHTCSGSNRLLRVGVRSSVTSGGDTITGVTYNGVAMTKIASQSATVDRWITLWELVDPDIGTHDIVATNIAPELIVVCAASYTGADAKDNHNTGATSGTALSVSATPVADNCWINGMFSCNITDIAAGSGTTNRNTSSGGDAMMCDNNAAISPAASTALNVTASSSLIGGVVASIVPRGGGGGGGQPTAKRWGGVEFGASRFHQGQGVKGW